jgi:hypothetical protein
MSISSFAVFASESTRRSIDLPPGFVWREAGSLRSATKPVVGVVSDLEDYALMDTDLPRGVSQVLPLIGLTPDVVSRADLVLSEHNPSVAGMLLALKPVYGRMAQIYDQCAALQEEPWILLAHLAVRDKVLTPYDDVGSPGVAAYREATIFSQLSASIELLVGVGFLERAFVERLNLCPNCRSARLLVREECAACRSSNVKDEPIVHHFRCGHQAPEKQFRSGEDFICPKCARPLLHFSVDYDQPGTVVSCAQCGHAAGESRIGYRCLDCNQKDDAERLETLDISSYALTGTARATVFDASWLPESQHLLSTSERALLRVESFLEAPHKPEEKRAVVAVRAMRNGHAVSPGDLAGNLLLAGRIIGERFPQSDTVGGSWNELLVLIQSSHGAKFEQELGRAADDCKRLLASSVKVEIDILGPR